MKGVSGMNSKLILELFSREELLRNHVKFPEDFFKREVRSRPNFESITSFIEKVVFNDPYTIILWKDKSKTIVKVLDGDEFVPETGVAVAICKKLFGSRADFKRFVQKYTPVEKEFQGSETLSMAVEAFSKFVRSL